MLPMIAATAVWPKYRELMLDGNLVFGENLSRGFA